MKKVGSGFVWWDFDPPSDLPENKFLFGHRVIVGLNHIDCTAYARISFFSALHFVILLGTVSVEASQAVVTDINPLAKSAPNDIHSWKEGVPTGAVSKPATSNAGLAEAIGSGRAQAAIHDLMGHIHIFERGVVAKEMLGKLTGAPARSEAARDKLFADIVSSESQRVLGLMRCVADDCKRRATNPLQRAISDFLEKSVELDPISANGLTTQATRSLAIACAALAKQMNHDYAAGILDQNRMEMLIGGGIGMHAVGRALLDHFA